MKIYERFDYAIFDLDGTLVDTLETYKDIFKSVLNKKPYNVPEKESEQFFDETVGLSGFSMRKQFIKMLEKHAPKFIAHTENLATAAYEMAREKIDYKLFPDAENVLEILHKHRVDIFLSTASVEKVAKNKLEKNKIYKYFKDTRFSPKNDGHLRSFIKMANVPPQIFFKKAFWIGDSEIDMELSSARGIYAIGITNTLSEEKLRKAGADKIIKNLSELPELKFPNSIFDII